MEPAVRFAQVRAYAKINLSLEVLSKRADGYHDLRTIFQTISMSDTLAFEFSRGPKTSLSLDCPIPIEDNLVIRAAQQLLDATKTTGRLRIRLSKRLPMGGGLGGGSSDAAAVLLALPALTGAHLEFGDLTAIARELGSDVPFFLSGGTALGLGRGTEIYPLPDAIAGRGLLVTPRVHVSTAKAYASLGRSLTSPGLSSKINNSQDVAFALGGSVPIAEWAGSCVNDFESAVFEVHAELGVIKEALARSGACLALLSGSGASLFGIYGSAEDRSRAVTALSGEELGRQMIHRFCFVGRTRYQKYWQRQLAEHIQPNTWPPRSRYAQ